MRGTIVGILLAVTVAVMVTGGGSTLPTGSRFTSTRSSFVTSQPLFAATNANPTTAPSTIDSLPICLKMLQSTHHADRIEAVRAMGMLVQEDDIESAVPLLVRRMQDDESWYVRQVAVESLSAMAMSRPRVVARMRAQLEHERSVRVAGALRVALAGDAPPAVPHEKREEGVMTLGRPIEEVLADLRKLSSSWRLRAVTELINLSNSRQIELAARPLVAATADPDPTVRGQAVVALASVAPYAAGEARRLILNGIIGAIADDSAEVRTLACAVVIGLRPRINLPGEETLNVLAEALGRDAGSEPKDLRASAETLILQSHSATLAVAVGEWKSRPAAVQQDLAALARVVVPPFDADANQVAEQWARRVVLGFPPAADISAIRPSPRERYLDAIRDNPSSPATLVWVVKQANAPEDVKILAMERLAALARADPKKVLSHDGSLMLEAADRLSSHANAALEILKPLVEHDFDAVFETFTQSTAARQDPTVYPLFREPSAKWHKSAGRMLDTLRKKEIGAEHIRALYGVAALAPLMTESQRREILPFLRAESDNVRFAAAIATTQAWPNVKLPEVYGLISLFSSDAAVRYRHLDEFGSGRLTFDEPLASTVYAGLLSQMKGQRPEIITAAARALGRQKVDPEEGIPLLVGTLTEIPESFGHPAHQRARTAIAKEIGRLGPKAPKAIEKILRASFTGASTEPDYAGVLGELGPFPATVAVALIDDADPKVRAKAIAFVADGYPSDEKAIAAITARMADNDAAVRRAAAAASERLGVAQPQAWTSLTAATKDPDPAVATAAIRALAAAGKPATTELRALPDTSTLIRLLSSDTAEDRIAAATVLGWRGPAAADAIAPLTRMAGNELPPVRMAAVRALAAVDPSGKESGPALIAVCRQGDGEAAAVLAPAVQMSSAREKTAARLKAIADEEPDAGIRSVERSILARIAIP